MTDIIASHVTMRPATRADLGAVLSLYAQPGMDDGQMLSLKDAEALFDRMKSYPDYTLLVAEIDGQIVGTLALLVMDNLGHLGARSAVVEDVVVSPDHQGQGIGNMMMRHAMARATAKRCYKMTLSSNMKRTAAHGFYDALGFRRHGYSFWIDLPTEAAP
jgi:ribosomal protein S18 acetylase RimI-like enzyme